MQRYRIHVRMEREKKKDRQTDRQTDRQIQTEISPFTFVSGQALLEPFVVQCRQGPNGDGHDDDVRLLSLRVELVADVLFTLNSISLTYTRVGLPKI